MPLPDAWKTSTTLKRMLKPDGTLSLDAGMADAIIKLVELDEKRAETAQEFMLELKRQIQELSGLKT